AYGELAGVETVKQSKQEVLILLSEKASEHIDGQKIFQITSKYGRMIGLGMEGKKLKAVLHIKGIKTNEWLNIAYEVIKGMQEAKKEQEHPT
ncbi:hypothetical protein OSJ97_24810, partial [Escherichia coli]|nr:hypothetical protein [Escherichia coli]